MTADFWVGVMLFWVCVWLCVMLLFIGDFAIPKEHAFMGSRHYEGYISIVLAHIILVTPPSLSLLVVPIVPVPASQSILWRIAR